jgi:hypothetical protein
VLAATSFCTWPEPAPAVEAYALDPILLEGWKSPPAYKGVHGMRLLVLLSQKATVLR